jgi:hypothetical protein
MLVEVKMFFSFFTEGYAREIFKKTAPKLTRYTGTSSPLGFWAAVAINMGWLG